MRIEYNALIKFIEDKQKKARNNYDIMDYEIIRQILEQLKKAKEKGEMVEP